MAEKTEWNGLCPAGIHRSDFKGQICNHCEEPVLASKVVMAADRLLASVLQDGLSGGTFRAFFEMQECLAKYFKRY